MRSGDGAAPRGSSRCFELQADGRALNAGPGFTGTIKLGGGQKLNYTTAWLFRTTGETPQNLWRFQLECEF